MRTLMAVFLLILPACLDKDPNAVAPVHAGEPTVRQRPGTVDTLPHEVQFINRMLEHEQRIGTVLNQARARDLSRHGRRIIEHADSQRTDITADLVAAREKYHGVAAPPTKAMTGSPAGGLEQLGGAAYEKALLSTLVSDYREEVADINKVLPRLNADVRGIAKQIRTQRLHAIDKLTRE